MTKEELFFKENYPEYVTEKGECLSPYWDLFSAGVICATFELNIENKKLKDKVSFLEDNLRVARKDRENLQLEVAKGLKDFVKDFPATAIRFMANEKYVEENDKLEKELGKLEGKLADLTSEYYELENLKNNEIAELKAYNEKLLDGDIEKHNKIVELKEQVDALANVNIKAQNIIGKAKEIIKRLLKETYGEGWNYSLQVKVEAEKFLKESE